MTKFPREKIIFNGLTVEGDGVGLKRAEVRQARLPAVTTLMAPHLSISSPSKINPEKEA